MIRNSCSGVENEEEPVGLTNPATTQAQSQGSKFTHPNIHPIYDLAQHLKGPVLQFQSFKISMTQDNSRVSRRSPSEGPVSKCSRNWRLQSRPMSLCSEHLQVILYRPKSRRCDSLYHTSASTMRFSFFFFSFTF